MRLACLPHNSLGGSLYRTFFPIGKTAFLMRFCHGFLYSPMVSHSIPEKSLQERRGEEGKNPISANHATQPAARHGVAPSPKSSANHLDAKQSPAQPAAPGIMVYHGFP
jgi:hypothetical protein